VKQAYKSINFRKDSLALIDTMNIIVASYMKQGFVLTVRQLYYQLVSQNVIPNTERSYKNTTSIVNDARLAGLMDWDAIEDRTRSFVRRSRWDSGRDIIDACAHSFHMDMWANQGTRVYVIIEKEALAGVMEGVCKKWDVPLLAARGYPSGTVLREFAETDLIPATDNGQEIVIFHLGDHDPSGIDMSRDLEERLTLFAGSSPEHFVRLALNMSQIQALNPPPNPAKTTDSRFEEYRRQYGDDSWELDALTPSYLTNLIDTNVTSFIDSVAWQEREQEIADVKERIKEVAEAFE
jgi:pentatricopeptide repeat protein